MAKNETFNWADDDDGDFLGEGSSPMTFESVPDEHGIKMISTVIERDGKKFQLVKRVRVVKRTARVNIRCEQRLKNWKKFGKAVDNDSSITVPDANDVPFDITGAKTKKSAVEKGIDREIERMLLPSQQKEGVFQARSLRDGGRKAQVVSPAEEKAKPKDEKTYRPPSQREGGRDTGGRTMSGPGGNDDQFTVRVTNLSEDITENDLRDLFGRYGNIARVFLARDKTTRTSKGFAFVTYYNRADGQKAIDKVTGFGYNHLILQVEWAKK